MQKTILWAAAGIIISLIFGTIYSVGQQSIRLSANDPQIQMAEDVAEQLNKGALPKSLVSGNIKINTSLTPFVIIYNKDGSVAAGNGYLSGKIPLIPYGVLTHTQVGKDNSVTWEPENGVRLATVTARADNYYVLSGRSMREIEKREAVILENTVLGYLVSLLVLVSIFITDCLPPKKVKKVHTIVK